MATVLYDFIIYRMERFGGISRYVTEIARHLTMRETAHITLLCGVHRNDYVASLETGHCLSVFGLRRPVRVASASIVGALDYAFLDLALVTRRFDLYHPSYYPRYIPKLGRTRLAATVYDLIQERLPEYHRGDDTARRKRALLDAADVVFAISKTTADDLTAIYNVDPSRIRVVYPGVDPGPARWSEPRTLHPRPFLLYVGRRGGYKDFAALLAAYSQAAAVHSAFDLVCLGGGDWTLAEQRVIDAPPLKGRVYRVDAPDTDLWGWYDAASALVITSRYEGFGLPLVEAMRRGCPVVANAAGSIPEIAGGAALLCDAHDAARLGHALTRICFDEALRSQLAAAGPARASLFTWDNAAREMEKGYDAVLGLA